MDGLKIEERNEELIVSVRVQINSLAVLFSFFILVSAYMGVLSTLVFWRFDIVHLLMLFLSLFLFLFFLRSFFWLIVGTQVMTVRSDSILIQNGLGNWYRFSLKYFEIFNIVDFKPLLLDHSFQIENLKRIKEVRKLLIPTSPIGNVQFKYHDKLYNFFYIDDTVALENICFRLNSFITR